MSKVYERADAGTITTDRGHIYFSVGDLKPDSKTERFTQCDSGDGGMQKVLGMTDKQIEAEIESSSMFKRGVPGKSGIWIKEKRRSAQQVEEQKTLFADFIRGFSDDELRGMAANLGLAIKMDSDRDGLIALILKAREDRKFSNADVIAPKKKGEKPKQEE
jgi:hypothetical protein